MFKFPLKQTKKFKYRVQFVWPGSGIPYKLIQTNKLQDIIHELNTKKLDITKQPHEYPHEIQDIPVFLKTKYVLLKFREHIYTHRHYGWEEGFCEYRVIDIPMFIYNKIPWEKIILYFSRTINGTYTKMIMYDISTKYQVETYIIGGIPTWEYWRSFEDVQKGFYELQNYIQNKPKVTDPKILQFLKTKL
jgi:hypothetical protein